MMMLRRISIRALQSMLLVLVGYAFVWLMTADVREQMFTTQLPDMGESGSRILDLVLFCVPGMLLFVLLGSFVRKPRRLGALFATVATLSAWLLGNLFSQAFGNTWSSVEIVVLLLVNLHWWLLALVPGLVLLFALDRFASKAGSYDESDTRL